MKKQPDENIRSKYWIVGHVLENKNLLYLEKMKKIYIHSCQFNKEHFGLLKAHSIQLCHLKTFLVY